MSFGSLGYLVLFSSSSGSSPSSNLRQLVSNTYVPNQMRSQSSSSFTGMCRRGHITQGGVSSLQAVWAGWFYNSITTAALVETALPNPYTVNFWVEYPVGTYTQVDTNFVVNPGVTNYLGSSATISIPSSTQFFTWTHYSGSTFPSVVDTSPTTQPLLIASTEVYAQGSAVLATPSSVLPADSNAGALAIGPLAIVGPPAGGSHLSVALIGDSRTFGYGDKADTAYNRGNLARSVGSVYDVINMGCNSDDQSHYNYSSSARRALLKYSDVVVVELGFNLINGVKASYTSALPYYNTLLGHLSSKGHKIVVATWEPSTNSSDFWETASGQTVIAGGDQTFQSSIRALSSYIELRSPVEDQSNLNKWITNGTSEFYTFDGLHPSHSGYLTQYSSVTASISTVISSASTPTGYSTPTNWNLTTVGTPVFDTTNPKFGSAALSTSGGSGYISGLAFTGTPQAIDFWGKVSTTSAVIMAGVGVAGAFGWLINPSASARCAIGGINHSGSGIFVADGAWHHYALNMDTSRVDLYVDGTSAVALTSFTYPAELTGGNLTFGNDSNIPPGAYYPVEVDEAATWNYGRYPTGSSFTPPSAPYTGTETGLISLHHFDGDLTGIVGPGFTL